MNILLIGSGGREHAFAMALAKSSSCKQLYIMPGNAGTSKHGINVAIDVNEFHLVAQFCLDNHITLLIVGPEDPLVKGLRDFFMADPKLAGIAFVGPDKKGAQMEGSKDWSKQFMQKYGIPTAAYKTFTQHNLEEGIAYLENHSLPIVLKADGLAAGKGVLICESVAEAQAELRAMIAAQKFGSASEKVVIEAFLHGIELSVFVVTDGTHYLVLPSAKDYKRIGEGDTGLNTGGMGAISPVPFADKAFIDKVEETIIKPTINGLKAEDIHYVGFIFVGLMNVNGVPKVIEYNSRMGDPETEVVLPRIQTDMVELMLAAGLGKLNEVNLQIDARTAVTVMLVSKGYPEAFERGKVMSGMDSVEGSTLYHAGTKLSETGEWLSNGGRVMAVTSLGSNIKEALNLSLQNAEKISFENKYYRKDNGFEFL
ncbi:MAG: phosphoribosylamine--glycine ligase [Bacteroidota bacterium]|nr:phosphoribosylamine--glycine ligase [Bacteroidota bacterium]